MKLRQLVTVLALAGLPVAHAPAWSAEAPPLVRSVDRSPHQIATLMRGYAAGGGWTLAEEVPLNAGQIIALRLCREAGEGTPARYCGQFAILGNDAGSEIVLLHIAPLPGGSIEDGETGGFAALLDAVSAPFVVPDESRLSCGALGCP